jgi:hypothetical protein
MQTQGAFLLCISTWQGYERILQESNSANCAFEGLLKRHLERRVWNAGDLHATP